MSLHPTTPSSSKSNFTITAENLGKRFTREWIFRKLSFEFHSGNTYAITGPNGSGKSTLLQTLWGQMLPSSGTLTYRLSNHILQVEAIHKHIAIATPYMDLVEEFTLMELVNFHFNLKRSRRGMKANEILNLMQLDHVKNRYIAAFSSGMKQRVKLALAFFTEADAIFLDEPGTNLDKPSFEWYQFNLADLPTNCLIIIASNQPSEYPETAKKIDIMQFK